MFTWGNKFLLENRIFGGREKTQQNLLKYKFCYKLNEYPLYLTPMREFEFREIETNDSVCFLDYLLVYLLCASVLVSMPWMPTVKGKGLRSRRTFATLQYPRIPRELGSQVGTNWTLLRPTLNQILTSPGLSHFLYQVTCSQRYSCWYSFGLL